LTSQQIVDVCKANWFANRSDCSAFVRAVTNALGLSIFVPSDDANAIVDKLTGDSAWSAIADLATVEQDATSGMLVIAGLKGGDFTPPRSHGHVVVVVQGDDSAHPGFPLAYWGTFGGIGQENSSIRNAFIPDTDLDNVHYFGYTFAALTKQTSAYDRHLFDDGAFAEVSTAVESLMTRIAELSSTQQVKTGSQSPPPDRVLFPNGIELIDLDVKVGPVEISLKIQGTKAP